MADLQKLVAKLESKVQPSEESFKFTPEQLEMEIEDALLEHNPDYTIDTLPREEEHLVLWLAMSSCFYTLAGKHAEGMWFQIENDEFHAEMPHDNYLMLAKQYEDKYQKAGGTLNVSSATRRDVGTGQLVPFYGEKV